MRSALTTVELSSPGITAAELLHGVHRLRLSKRETRAEAVVETLLASIPVIHFDLVIGAAFRPSRDWSSKACREVD